MNGSKAWKWFSCCVRPSGTPIQWSLFRCGWCSPGLNISFGCLQLVALNNQLKSRTVMDVETRIPIQPSISISHVTLWVVVTTDSVMFIRFSQFIDRMWFVQTASSTRRAFSETWRFVNFNCFWLLPVVIYICIHSQATLLPDKHPTTWLESERIEKTFRWPLVSLWCGNMAGRRWEARRS